MKTLRAAPVLALLLAGCSGYHVRSDFDAKADFSAYHSYAFDLAKDGKGQPILGPELLERRVQRAVAAEMQARNLSVAEQPDLIVLYHPELHVKRGPVFSFGIGVGSFGPGGGVGAGLSKSTGGRANLWADILLEVQDAKEHRALWSGSVENAVDPDLSPEEAEVAVQKAVKDLLAGFPPRQAAR